MDLLIDQQSQCFRNVHGEVELSFVLYSHKT